MLAAIGVGIYFFGVEYPRQRALAGPDGRDAIGTIAFVGTEQSGKYNGYFADIDFADEQGRSHHFRSYYTPNDWSYMQQGGRVSVRYLARDPDYAMEPHSYKAKRDPRTMVLIGWEREKRRNGSIPA